MQFSIRMHTCGIILEGRIYLTTRPYSSMTSLMALSIEEYANMKRKKSKHTLTSVKHDQSKEEQAPHSCWVPN